MATPTTITVTLTRPEAPGTGWTAFVDDGDLENPGVNYDAQPMPGDLLELIGEDLDTAERLAQGLPLHEAADTD